MTGPVNGLPPHLSEKDVPEAKIEETWRHQWLYSVVPVGTDFKPYLTGYCRGCGRAFSEFIPYNTRGTYIQTTLNVPTYGCRAPE